MSRRKDIRRPRPELKLHVEPLEPRWLLSADARRPRPEQPAASLARALESLLESGADADSFARNLVQHPRLANDLGLGGLSLALRQHAGYAARHGWGATLVYELDTHPRYAAAHHLTALLTTQTSAPGTTVATATSTAPVATKRSTRPPRLRRAPPRPPPPPRRP
jgi:hypothetical protein